MRVIVTIADTQTGVTKISMDEFTAVAGMADTISQVIGMVVSILKNNLLLIRIF